MTSGGSIPIDALKALLEAASHVDWGFLSEIKDEEESSLPGLYARFKKEKATVEKLYLHYSGKLESGVIRLGNYQAYTLEEIAEAIKSRGGKASIKTVQRHLRALNIKPLNPGKRPLRYLGSDVRLIVLIPLSDIAGPSREAMANRIIAEEILALHPEIQKKGRLPEFLKKDAPSNIIASIKARGKLTQVMTTEKYIEEKASRKRITKHAHDLSQILAAAYSEVSSSLLKKKIEKVLPSEMLQSPTTGKGNVPIKRLRGTSGSK